MEDHSYFIITTVLTTIAVVGSFSNLAAIIVIARSRMLWNRQTLLILNVACADFIVATFGILLPLLSSLYRRWIFGELACRLYAFTTDIVGIASLTTLAFLALDRALKVRQSSWSSKIPRTLPIVGLIWIYSFVITCPPLFGWGDFVLEEPGISCSIDWQSTSWNSVSYIIFLLTMGFLVQLIILTVSYASLYLLIQQIATGPRASQTVARAEKRVGCMLTTMVLCYLIAWLPYTIVALLKVSSALSGMSSNIFQLNGVYGYLPSLLAKSSIVYNPIIYVLFNTQFRRKLFVRHPTK